MSLPLRLPWDKAQDRWATDIQPILNFPPNNGVLLKNIKLINGVTTINHLLGRMQQGWIRTDQDADANIHRSAAFNSLTLQLTSSAAVTISLWVY